MKKTSRKKHHSVRRRSVGSPIGTYVVIFLIVIFLILLAKVAVRAFRKPFVLGVSTSRLLSEAGNPGSIALNSGLNLTNVSNEALVDCVGPDGRHFQTVFKECLELNNAYKKSSFDFTPLTGATASAVSIDEKVPVWVDSVTKELSVKTPAGVKTITVLPDQVVTSLIANKEITSVTQQSTNFGASAPQKIALTELNNEPVYQVDGILNKKLLGVVPLSFVKTSFVSGTTGNVIKTDEAAINKILEALSF